MSLKQYAREIIDLLGNDKLKLPWILCLFLFSSMLDILGLGLIGPYIALVVNPDLQTNTIFFEIIELFGLPEEHKLLLIILGFILIGVFSIKAVLNVFITRIISF